MAFWFLNNKSLEWNSFDYLFLFDSADRDLTKCFFQTIFKCTYIYYICIYISEEYPVFFMLGVQIDARQEWAPSGRVVVLPLTDNMPIQLSKYRGLPGSKCDY